MKGTVMLVEDDNDILTLLSQLLQLEGYAVLACGSGREALETLREGARPSVILLDLMMPDLDGWQFREQQLANPSLAQIPVVVMSGQGKLEAEVTPLRVAAYLKKPVDLDELLRVVEGYNPAPEPPSLGV